MDELPYGTTQPGERLVVITEELFQQLIDSESERSGEELSVEWGGPTTGTITFFTPAVFVTVTEDDPPVADPLTLADVGG